MTTGVVGGRNGDGTYTQGTPTSSIFYVRPATPPTAPLPPVRAIRR
jgi:hypothetical protein